MYDSQESQLLIDQDVLTGENVGIYDVLIIVSNTNNGEQ